MEKNRPFKSYSDIKRTLTLLGCDTIKKQLRTDRNPGICPAIFQYNTIFHGHNQALYHYNLPENRPVSITYMVRVQVLGSSLWATPSGRPPLS